jgi:hypothetical protein
MDREICRKLMDCTMTSSIPTLQKLTRLSPEPWEKFNYRLSDQKIEIRTCWLGNNNLELKGFAPKKILEIESKSRIANSDFRSICSSYKLELIWGENTFVGISNNKILVPVQAYPAISVWHWLNIDNFSKGIDLLLDFTINNSKIQDEELWLPLFAIGALCEGLNFFGELPRLNSKKLKNMNLILSDELINEIENGVAQEMINLHSAINRIEE